MAPFFIGLLSVLLGIVSVLIVFIVLMQRPKQEGLGAAFGGGMTDQMFGAQTTNVLQKGTVYLAVMFFVFSMILSVLTAKSVRSDSDTIDAMKAAPVPAGDRRGPGLPGDFPWGARPRRRCRSRRARWAPEPAGGATEPADVTPLPWKRLKRSKKLRKRSKRPRTRLRKRSKRRSSAMEVPAVIEEAADEVPAVIEEEQTRRVDLPRPRDRRCARPQRRQSRTASEAGARSSFCFAMRALRK